METEQKALTSTQVAQYLIGKGLYLTGLEFLAEGQELGGFDLTFLQNFFSDTTRFPPEEVQRFQGEDVLSSILLAKEREQKLCLAEYELRVATEDLRHTKGHMAMDQRSPHELQTPVRSPCFASFTDAESDELKERKHLNSVVMAYLMQSGYKVTALTFQEEANPEFEKDIPEGETLATYFRMAEETTETDAEPQKSPIPDANGLEKSFDEESDRGPSTMETSNPDASALPVPERQPSQIVINSIPTDTDRESEIATPVESPQILEMQICSPSSDLLAVLMENLPKIVPNVLIKKRSECIPVLATLIRDHPDVACRRSLIEMLFGLIKHPDEEQRQVIVQGVGLVAECVGRERTTQEIIPHCCQLASHNKSEKRLLVAEVLGVIASHVEEDIRSSVLLSLLQQLSTDAQPSVRKAALSSLLLSLKSIEAPSHKQRTFEDLLVTFATDLDNSISETAHSEFAPLLRDGKCGLKINMLFLQRLFHDIHEILDSSPLAAKTDRNANEQSEALCIPRNGQQKQITSLLQLYCDLLPMVALMCTSLIPSWVAHDIKRVSSKDPLSLVPDKGKSFGVGEGGHGMQSEAFEKWFDEHSDDEECQEVFIFVTQVVPAIISCIRRIAPVNECFKLREQFASVTKTTCKSFEPCIVTGAIKPLFLSASGLQKVYSTSSLTRSKKLLSEIMRLHHPEMQDAACVFPICLSAIVAEAGTDAVYGFISRLLESRSPDETPWAIQNKKDFVSAVGFCANASSVHDMLSVCFTTLSGSKEIFMRCGSAVIAEALCVHASLQDVQEHILPIVFQLSDDAELTVRLHAISALQQVSLVYPNASKLLNQIQVVIEKIITRDVPQARLSALSAFASACSSCNFHVPFVLKQLPVFLDEIREGPKDGKSFHLSLTATAVFDALLVLEGVEILDSNLRGQLMATMENFMHLAGSYLDNAQRQILSAMMSDQTSKLGVPKRRILSFSMPSKKVSVSSDNSSNSEASHH